MSATNGWRGMCDNSSFHISVYSCSSAYIGVYRHAVLQALYRPGVKEWYDRGTVSRQYIGQGATYKHTPGRAW